MGNFEDSTVRGSLRVFGTVYARTINATTITGALTGNASTASKLNTLTNIGLSGDASGNIDFDGSTDVVIPVTLSNTGVTAGTYTKMTVDAKGRITAASNPNTLAGYGITDAQALDSDLTAIANLSTTGMIIRTGTGTALTRSIAVSGTGLSVTNQDGIAGNPTIASNATNANTASTIVARDSSGNFSAGTITANLTGTATKATNIVGGSAGTIPYQTAADTTAMLAAGTVGQVLKSNGAAAPSWQTLDMTYIPDATFKKSCAVATTGDIGASLQTVSTLTGYTNAQSLACTTTAASTTVTTTSTAGLKVGAVINTPTVQLAAGTTVATIVSATQFTVNNRAAIATTAITSNGTTATATFAAQTYAPYAVGSSITITGATPTTYNGTFVVTACTTTSVSWASTETVTATVQGSIAFTIAAGTSITTAFTQSISALNIDGVAVATNDRVLVRAQTQVGGINVTANRDNGIYTVTNTGSTSVPWVLTRVSDADSASKIASALVAVDKGTTYGGMLFDNDFKTTDVLGSTALAWNMTADNGKKLNFFAATTSAELAAVISDETGSGKLVFGTSPTLTTPTISGNLTLSGGSILAANSLAVAAAGTTQATATAITTVDLVQVTSGSGGVVLPTAVVGRSIQIINGNPNAINVYPAVSGYIDALAINIPISLATGATMTFTGVSTTKWKSSVSYATEWDKVVNKPGVIDCITTTTGTGTAYVASGANFVLHDGSVFVLKLHVANEKGATLNVNSTGAKAIVDIAGKAIEKGFAAGSYMTVVYNGTNYVLQGGGAGGGGGTGAKTVYAVDIPGANLYQAEPKCAGGTQGYYDLIEDTVYSNIIVANFDGLMYGSYAVMIRLAYEGGGSDTIADLFRIQTYHVVGATETLLNTATMKGTDFPSFTGAYTDYEVFGFVTKFRGAQSTSSPTLRVKISYGPHGYEEMVHLDYISVMPAPSAIYTLPTT